MRLLLAEDNAALGELLARALAKAGFVTDLMGSAAGADQALTDSRYAAVILDLGLPDEDGMSLLRRIRQRHDSTPVLILTARGSVADRVDGLQAGADDYLVKPFATEELLARLQALLRRPGEIMGRRLQVGDLALDVETRQVFVGDQPEIFSAREIGLLELLMRRPGRVAPKRFVEDQLFSLDAPVGSNAIEVAVHRLRKHLEALGASTRVHTVRGVGYFIAETPP
jgi:DNA-binding response OmpR family regulator